MINVNQITADLARMPDAALKQYATMHKNDPYTMSLAMSESNRRKQIREGAAPQGGQQPTVVDQELSQMGMPQMPQGQAQAMPEDLGIGALPQQPMGKAMAEGGIVAFAPGGSTGSNAAFVDFLAGIGKTGSDFVNADTATQKSLTQAFEAATGGGPKVPVGGVPAASTAVPAAAASVPFQAAAGVIPGMQYLKGLGGAAMRGASKLGIVQLGEHLFGTSDQEKRDLAKSDPVYRAELEKQGLFSGTPATGTGTTEASGRSAFAGQGATGTNVPYVPAASAPDAAADTGGGGLADAAAKQKVAASSPAAPRAAPTPAKDFLTQQREMEGRYGEVTDPLEARRKALTEKDIAGRREGIATLKADQESEMKSMFAGKEERIGKREQALEKSKDTNTGMAFLQAGLAMMQSRGPGLSGIAQGAGVGLKQYGEGIEKIKSAQEKLDDARDRMEELRQNQSSMNKREVRAEEKGIRDTAVTGERDLLTGIEKVTGEKRADIRAAVASNIVREESALERQNRLQAAGIAAAPGLERNRLLAAAQDTEAKVRKDYGTLQTKVMADLSKDPTYSLEQDPIKKTAIYNNALRNALQNNPFLSQYAGNVGFGGSSGKVRELAGVDEAD